MIDTHTTLAELAQRHPYGTVEVGGHRWLISQYGNRTELSGFSSGQLPTVTIAETLGSDGAAPTYSAKIDYQRRGHDLFARQGDFASVEDALAWATTFQWSTRQVGSLTWVAATADATRWYTQIGASTAEIVAYTAREGDAPHYYVTRELTLGAQKVEFKIGDNTLGDETRGIVSFEQASAIALTMPDYVIELMRVPDDAHQPVVSADPA